MRLPSASSVVLTQSSKVFRQPPRRVNLCKGVFRGVLVCLATNGGVICEQEMRTIQ
jgi:hypothetical protein